jgi:hypothetical protein
MKSQTYLRHFVIPLFTSGVSGCFESFGIGYVECPGRAPGTRAEARNYMCKPGLCRNITGTMFLKIPCRSLKVIPINRKSLGSKRIGFVDIK